MNGMLPLCTSSSLPLVRLVARRASASHLLSLSPSLSLSRPFLHRFVYTPSTKLSPHAIEQYWKTIDNFAALKDPTAITNIHFFLLLFVFSFLAFLCFLSFFPFLVFISYIFLCLFVFPFFMEYKLKLTMKKDTRVDWAQSGDKRANI